MVVLEVREFVDPEGRSPFGIWFDRLDAVSAARVAVSLARLEAGSLSTTKAVGKGVLECRINVGPGIASIWDATARRS
jgi:putative addiction module killer protein